MLLYSIPALFDTSMQLLYYAMICDEQLNTPPVEATRSFPYLVMLYPRLTKPFAFSAFEDAY